MVYSVPQNTFCQGILYIQNVIQFHSTQVKAIPLTPIRAVKPSLYACLIQQISSKSTTDVESAG
jgi:hypothetical protein